LEGGGDACGGSAEDTDIGVGVAGGGETVPESQENERERGFHGRRRGVGRRVGKRKKLVYEIPTIHAVKARGREQLAMLTPAVRRLLNPQTYPAGIEWTLAERKSRLVGEAGLGKEVL
jgi:hypothetical protein